MRLFRHKYRAPWPCFFCGSDHESPEDPFEAIEVPVETTCTKKGCESTVFGVPNVIGFTSASWSRKALLCKRHFDELGNTCWTWMWEETEESGAKAHPDDPAVFAEIANAVSPHLRLLVTDYRSAGWPHGKTTEAFMAWARAERYIADIAPTP